MGCELVSSGLGRSTKQRRPGKTGKPTQIFPLPGPPLPAQSAIRSAVITITRTVTVAAGVFAPGHLGELTWQVPFELADAVLEETRRRILITVGVGCILFGGIFFAANHSGHNVVATVTHEGPCSNGTCTVDVVYSAGGRQVTAVMYGVPSGEVYGSPWPR